MPQMKPSVISKDIACAETPAPANALIVFGASGDLTNRKLLPSVFEIFARDLLTEPFYLVGCGRKELTDQQFRKLAEDSIRKHSPDPSPKKLTSFLNLLHYSSGAYDDPAFYEKLKLSLCELDRTYKVDGPRIFYLAVPPLPV